jgi:hypothetical protein
MNLTTTILSLSATHSSFTRRSTPLFKLKCDDTTTRLLSSMIYLERMTMTVFDDDDILHPGIPYSWERTLLYAPTPCYLCYGCTPSVICSSPDPEDIVYECPSPLHETV